MAKKKAAPEKTTKKKTKKKATKKKVAKKKQGIVISGHRKAISAYALMAFLFERFDGTVQIISFHKLC